MCIRDSHKLVDVCQRLTEKIILRAGGRITADAYVIPVQRPEPAPLEQWESPAREEMIARIGG